jgi:SAM-dependent methyltransferase
LNQPKSSVKTTQQLAAEALAQGQPTAWFESVYQNAQGNAGQIPWASLAPHPLLVDWLTLTQPQGRDKQALVIGCGLGDDGEILSQFGFIVSAFDISPTAIDWCRQRFPQSSVNYQVADLLDLPTTWYNQFDLVVEVRTIQSLPVEIRNRVLKACSDLIKPEGIMLLVTNLRTQSEPLQGPPWKMSNQELNKLNQYKLFKIDEIEFQSLVRLNLSKTLTFYHESV